MIEARKMTYFLPVVCTALSDIYLLYVRLCFNSFSSRSAWAFKAFNSIDWDTVSRALDSSYEQQNINCLVSSISIRQKSVVVELPTSFLLAISDLFHSDISSSFCSRFCLDLLKRISLS